MGNPTHQMIPVFGSWQGLSEGVKLSETPVAYVDGWKSSSGNNSIFAVYVHGERMSPRFLPGELAFINPVLPPQRGKYVLVELHNHHAIFRQLLSFSLSHITLRQHNPPRIEKIPMEKIKNFSRVWAIFGR
ncbi:S24 family peptidase [Thalassospira xiamenensis]|uniref:S24 family peptidase n=1 Tax=Thalassospira xiamenensis TaxID=220697 RepID=UPI003AA8DC42